MNKVEEAIHYAVDAHAGTFRDSTKIPYILHPLEAAAIAAALTDDQDIVAAAVLHDVVEDTDRSMEEIKSRFGERVAHFVDCDTENKRPELPSEETWQIRKQETIDRIPKLSDDELIVVFADKLANLRAIWNDYLMIWEELWKRFSAPDPSRQLWYYHSIYDACERLADSPLYWEYKWRLTEIEMRVQEYKEFGRHSCNSLDVIACPGDKKWVFRREHSTEVITMTEEQFSQFMNGVRSESGKATSPMLIHEQRFVRTERGRVFRLDDPSIAGDNWLLEVVDGKLVKPIRPVAGDELMEAAVLPELVVRKLLSPDN